MCKRLIYSTCFLLVLAVVQTVTYAQQVENLAPNSSFEEDEVILNDSAYEQWWTWGWEVGLTSTVEIDEADFVDGKRSLKVNPLGDTNWWFIVAVSPIPAEVGTNYTASFWAKAEEPRPLAARFKATDNSVDWGYTDFELTTEWAEYSMTSESQNAEIKFEVFCAGSEVVHWLDFVNVYKGEYVPGIGPSLASPPEIATNPNPADGSIHPETWATLSWKPGVHAVSHDVYFGDNFNDVDNGAEGTFIGNQGETFYVAGFPNYATGSEGLTPGMTYYWRIDEVNDAEPNSPWKGDVWRFSIPPKTAYFPEPADGAESVNINVELRWTPGFGAKLHTVYFGDSFEDVDNATGGLTQGTKTYNPGELKMAKTYYWRVDEFDVVETHKGGIWSFITEGAVASPNPANGAVDVTQSPILTWSPGFGASHEVYFGTDAGSLENKSSGNLGSESYDPGQLEWNTTYYWRVDEANSANADSPWTGPLWSFTTANFIIIDDMESYSDIDQDPVSSNRIYNAWVDGFEDPTNGSQVGYLDIPSYEDTIVHSGDKSMPFIYDNAVGKSEATSTLTDKRDWTVNGVNTLTIWFRGDGANAAEQMYVALNDNARIDHDDPDAATSTSWKAWNIDLQAFADQGVNLSNVDSITLGLSSVTGGTGIMYFDDIRLYALEPATP
jgi:hypothetical protein